MCLQCGNPVPEVTDAQAEAFATCVGIQLLGWLCTTRSTGLAQPQNSLTYDHPPLGNEGLAHRLVHHMFSWTDRGGCPPELNAFLDIWQPVHARWFDEYIERELS